jgi:hypothetical protein
MVVVVILLSVLQLCMRARAELFCDCCVFNKKHAVFVRNTLIVLRNLLWHIAVAILLVAFSVWIVLFSL